MNARGFIETLRRLLLVAGIAAAAALCFVTGFAPYVTVERPKARPAAKIEVQGPAWQAFIADVNRSFADNMPVPGWEWRILARELADARRENPLRAAASAADREDEADRVKRLKENFGVDVTFRGNFGRLHFAASEAPLSEIAARLKDHETTLVTCASCGNAQLSVMAHPAYRLHGFSDVITVPRAFAYPYRGIAWWPLAAGVLLYALLPWGRRDPDALAYTRWRLVLGDVAGTFLLFGMFFAAPLAIIGGTIEAIVDFPVFVAFFWGLAALGFIVIYWSAWAAAYRLKVARDRLEVSALGSARVIALRDVLTIEPVCLRPPKWLIGMSWLAVFLGSGTSSMGQAGRAMLLSSSASNGLRLRLRGGGGLYIWFSDQMGNEAVTHFGRLNRTLRECGATWAAREDTVRAIVPPHSVD